MSIPVYAVSGKELLRLVSKFREFLIEERNCLLETYCMMDAEGEPDRSSMEPDDALHVQRVENLLEEVNTALRT